MEGELKSNQENIQRLEERIAQKEKELNELQELFEKQAKELSSTIKRLDETKVSFDLSLLIDKTKEKLFQTDTENFDIS
jgi:septal ring factor EnvC (AmiA/AmiB activator)